MLLTQQTPKTGETYDPSAKSSNHAVSLLQHVYTYIYIYIYTCVYVYIHICVYIYIYVYYYYVVFDRRLPHRLLQQLHHAGLEASGSKI